MNAQEIYEEGLAYEESRDYSNAAFNFITVYTLDRTLPIAYKLGRILFCYK